MISPGVPATAKPWFWLVIAIRPGAQVLDRVVGAAVAERQLEGLQARRAREQLVAEADAEHRLGRQQRADVLDDVVQRGGVAGAGHEEEAVGVARQQLLGGARAREDLERRAAAGEVADDRALDPGVQRDDPRAVALACVYARARRSSPRGRGRGRPCSARRRCARAPRSTATSAAKIPPRIAPAERMWRTSARVSTPADARDAVLAQPAQPALLGAGRVVVVDRRAHDRARRVDAVGLHRRLARRRSCRRARS